MEKKIEELLDLQEQYKSREVAMTRSLEESGEKVSQLSNSVASFKSIISDTKKAIDMLENKCRHLENIISAKDRKIIALADKISSYTSYNDINIEPEIYSNIDERKLWMKRRSESEYDLEIQKKYTFRLTLSIALSENSIR